MCGLWISKVVCLSSSKLTPKTLEIYIRIRNKKEVLPLKNALKMENLFLCWGREPMVSYNLSISSSRQLLSSWPSWVVEINTVDSKLLPE